MEAGIGGRTVSSERCSAFIRQRRLALGINQREAGERAGVAQSQWGRWESTGSPAANMLPRIARSLELDAADFIAAIEPESDLARVEHKLDEILARLHAVESRL